MGLENQVVIGSVKRERGKKRNKESRIERKMAVLQSKKKRKIFKKWQDHSKIPQINQISFRYLNKKNISFNNYC